jgi:hypothetical protein
MTSKNVLMVFGAVVALMGVWSLLAVYAGFPSLDATEPVWHAFAKVLVGGFAVFVAYREK